MSGFKDWLALIAAVVGLLVGVKLLVTNPIEDRLSRMETRISARLDAQQAETNRRFEAVDVRFDAVLEEIRNFDRRVSRLEGRLDELSTGGAE